MSIKWPVVRNGHREPFDPVNGAWVDRTTKFGNPFKITKSSTRESVIAEHARWIMANPELLSQLHELKGKDLYCWCAPLKCHGDILLILANEVENDED